MFPSSVLCKGLKQRHPAALSIPSAQLVSKYHFLFIKKKQGCFEGLEQIKYKVEQIKHKVEEIKYKVSLVHLTVPESKEVLT